MMALRIRGTFIETTPEPWQDMTSDQVRKRSASAPPKVGAEPGTTIDQQFDQYLAGLIERAALLPLGVIQTKQCSEQLLHASCGSGTFDSPRTLSTYASESPSTANLESQFEDHPATSTIAECQPITTLMLCGLPCRLCPQEIIDVIDEKGFSDAVDLLYVPPPPQTGRRAARPWTRNLGYAFVNLKTPELATAFAHAFHKFAFPNNCSAKRCYTKPAHVQGFEANAERNWEERASFIVRRR